MTPTLEQQLALRCFSDRISQMDEAAIKSELCEMYAQMMRMDNYYKARLRDKWGIG